MDLPSYQQILAEVYEDNAKNILVHQGEYDDEEIAGDDKHPDEIVDQHEFQEFKGSRQIVEVPTNIPKHVDGTKHSITYERDVKLRVINIDSRFRTIPSTVYPLQTKQYIFENGVPVFYTSNLPDVRSSDILQLNTLSTNTPTNFLYKLTTPIKNVISVRVSSVEIPNTFYAFSKAHGNLSVRICYPSGQTSKYFVATIEEGNYIVDTTANLLPSNLILALENALNENPFRLTFNVNFDLISSTLTITTSIGNFDLDFLSDSIFASRVSDWGLGYNLGFSKTVSYTGQSSYTGTSVVNAIGGNYLFLNLDPDWRVLTHTNYDTAQINSFAKIVVRQPKNTVIYDNGMNLLTKEYVFDKPTTVRSFRVRLTDLYDEDIDLVGQEMSFTLELKEIMSHTMYNHYVNIDAITK